MDLISLTRIPTWENAGTAEIAELSSSNIFLKKETKLNEGIDITTLQDIQARNEYEPGKTNLTPADRKKLQDFQTRAKAAKTITFQKKYKDENDEEEDQEPELTAGEGLKTAAPSWLVPKPITNIQGKLVQQGVTTKQQIKASDERKSLSAALRKAKTPQERAKLRAQYRSSLKEENEFKKLIKEDKNIIIQYGYINEDGENIVTKQKVYENSQFVIEKIYSILYGGSLIFEGEVIYECLGLTPPVVENQLERIIELIPTDRVGCVRCV